MMTFAQRVGLLKVCTLVHDKISADLKDTHAVDDPRLQVALDWIEAELDADAKLQTNDQRRKEWAAADRCTRCGDYDSQCICYSR